MRDTKLIYTDDPKKNQKCPKCREYISECECAPQLELSKWDKVAVLRVEKSGRGGKIVTVIDRLPSNEEFLKILAKELKTKLGTGGTFRCEGTNGIIEIQGDKREKIKEILSRRNITCKGI